MKWVGVPQWVRTDGASPTCPKPRQQVSNASHVHTQPWTYGAGWSEEAGRVIEPRTGESRGPQEHSPGHPERNADGFQGPEGRSPGGGRASTQDPTGVEERGLASQGELGNVGAPSVALSPFRTGGPGAHRPWRGVGVSPRARAREGPHERTATGKGSGRERQAQCPARGSEAVFAAYRPGAGGALRPPGPTGGQATPGRTLWWTERRERRCDHQPSPRNSNTWQSKRPAIPLACFGRWGP